MASLSPTLLKITMVDLKKQGQQSNAQEKSDNKNERWNQRKGFRSEEKKKDPDAIPILKYARRTILCDSRKRCQKRCC